MKTLLFDIYVHPLTVIYITIALFTGRFSFLFIHLFVAFIHEMGHIIASLALKVKVKSLSMLPFGFYAQIDNLEDASIVKQIIILASGPLTIFISLAIIRALYYFDIISLYGYKHGYEACFLVCFFNLLPLYPLDGGRILKTLFVRFIEESKAQVWSSLVSIVMTVFLSYRCLKTGQLIIFFFLIFSQIKMIIEAWRDYPKRLLLRAIKDRPTKIKISSSPKFYRYYDNYYLENGKMHDEEEIIKIKLQQWNKINNHLLRKHLIKRKTVLD